MLGVFAAALGGTVLGTTTQSSQEAKTLPCRNQRGADDFSLHAEQRCNGFLGVLENGRGDLQDQLRRTLSFFSNALSAGRLFFRKPTAWPTAHMDSDDRLILWARIDYEHVLQDVSRAHCSATEERELMLLFSWPCSRLTQPIITPQSFDLGPEVLTISRYGSFSGVEKSSHLLNFARRVDGQQYSPCNTCPRAGGLPDAEKPFASANALLMHAKNVSRTAMPGDTALFCASVNTRGLDILAIGVLPKSERACRLPKSTGPNHAAIHLRPTLDAEFVRNLSPYALAWQVN